jgi:hypothetical protein
MNEEPKAPLWVKILGMAPHVLAGGAICFLIGMGIARLIQWLRFQNWL